MFTFREIDDLPGMTWCLRFEVEHFAAWKDQFTIHLWEGKNKASYGKTKSDEQKYIQDAYGDIEMQTEDILEEDDEHEDENESDHVSQSGSDDGEDTENEGTESFAQGSKNEQLAVGYKNDLSFVTRGDMIGVFAHKDDKFKFRTAIDRVRDLDGNAFSPRKVRSLPCPCDNKAHFLIDDAA